MPHPFRRLRTAASRDRASTFAPSDILSSVLRRLCQVFVLRRLHADSSAFGALLPKPSKRTRALASPGLRIVLASARSAFAQLHAAHRAFAPTPGASPAKHALAQALISPYAGERGFLYMPFEHSEVLPTRKRLRLF